ncbi:MAG: CDP-glucose 4,6-dehydratase, partial [Akkermansiaceae bacterium]|nr:CDP-glucose 4,6-dehydratase [Akkermansiaceae bacterium]
QIPVETFATNVMGTAHVLDALRQLEHPCAALCITTDKCYENREWLHAYREEDAMGGHDPYSASKGAAELVISSFRRSFFPPSANIRLASARAGNVIGGGDWALDRIVPDCIRALRSGTPIPVRNKIATRPWQHVLEPLSGYLDIASRLGRSAEPHLQSAFNFGPPLHSNRTVAELVQELLKHLPGEWIDASDPAAVHEASKLNLATDKAFHLLGWHSVWDFSETLQITAQWYGKHAEGCDIVNLTRDQIQRYQSRASQSGLPWAMA